MLKKAFLVFLVLSVSLCIFIACDNGIAFVNEMKEDTSSGGGGGGGGGSTLIPITVTANPQSKFYGDPDPDFGQDYTVSPDPLPSGVSLTGVMTREAGEDVGVYAITQGTLALTGKNASKYTLSFTGSSLTIAEKDVVTIIVKDGLGKFEGEDDPLFTYEAGSFLVYPGVEALALRGLTISGALAREAGEVAGTYAFNQGTITLNGETAGEYNLVFANIPGAVFTISAPGAITVIPNDVEKYYNDVDPALTYTFTPMLPEGVEFDGALSREGAGTPAGEDVGEYDIVQNTLTLTGTHAGNYYISFTSGKKLTVKKIPVTVTADSFTKVKGESFPDLTFTNDRGLLVSDFTGALSCTAADTSTTGTFPITRGTLAITGAAANNYSFEDANFVAGNLVVTAKTVITVTPNNQTKYYGDPEPTYTFSFTPTPEAGVTFNPATSLGRTAGENVGTYAINAGNLALQGDKKDNYIISVVNGKTLTISKKSVAITAYDRNKEYSDADPELTFGSNPSLPPAAFTGSLSGTTVNNVPGSYDITRGGLELSTASDGNGRYIDNYEIGTFTKGTMTINKKSVTVTADAKTKVSNGTEPTLTYTSSPALPAAAFTGALTRAAGETVGQNYAITQGTLALSTNSDGNGQYNKNYDITTFNGANVTIVNKIPIEVTADAKSKTYGDSDPSFTYTLSAALPVGITITGDLTREDAGTPAGENVGLHNITRGTLNLSGDSSSNYEINFTGAKLTITQKAVKVTAYNRTKVYGDSDPELTYVSVPALAKKSGQEPFINSLAREEGEAVNDYEIGKGTLALNPSYPDYNNYSFTPADFTTGTLTISKKTVTVTADDKTKVVKNNVNVPVLSYNGGILEAEKAKAFTGELYCDKPEVANEVVNVSGYDIVQKESDKLRLSDNWIDNEDHSKGKYSQNYNLVFVPGKYYVIDLIPINVIAVNQTISFGESPVTSGNGAYIYTKPDGTNITITGNIGRSVLKEGDEGYDPLDPEKNAANTSIKARNTAYLINDYSDLQINDDTEGLYRINFTPATLKINKKVVAVTAENKVKDYAGDSPGLTFTTSPELDAGAFAGAITWADNETNYHDYIDQHDYKDFDIIQGTLKLSAIDVDNVHPEYGSYKDNYLIDFNQGTMRVKKPAVKPIAGTTLKAKIKNYHDNNAITTFSRTYEDPPGGAEIIENSGSYPLYMWVDGTTLKYAYTSTDLARIEITGSAEGLFQECGKFTTIDVSGLRLADSLMSAAHMFDSCVLLKEVIFTGFNTGKVTDMSYMFYKAGFNYFPSYATGVSAKNTSNNTINLVISNAVFNTSSVKNMSYMFSLCSATDLSGINISSWDVSNVSDMSYMFAGYSKDDNGWKYWYNKFASLDLDEWNTASCTTFAGMFMLCNRLTSLDLSGWNFTNVTTVNRMFERCENITGITFPERTVLSSMKDMEGIFNVCLLINATEFGENIIKRWDIRNCYLNGGDKNAEPPDHGFKTYAGNYNKEGTAEYIGANRLISSDNKQHDDFNTTQDYFTYGKTGDIEGPGKGPQVHIGGNNLGGINDQRLVMY